MKSGIILICCIFLAMTPSVMAQRKVPASSQGLTLTIHLHGWATVTGRKEYLAGKQISIRAVWKNAGKKPITFLLKDHDPYHGTLAYPLFVWTRVSDSSGKVLTKSDDSYGVKADGWWSAWLLGGDAFIHGGEMPGDIITLKPGEEVTRIVPLDRMLAGLKSLPKGLETGTYTVELFYSDPLNETNATSNKLEIKVVADK